MRKKLRWLNNLNETKHISATKDFSGINHHLEIDAFLLNKDSSTRRITQKHM